MHFSCIESYNKIFKKRNKRKTKYKILKRRIHFELWQLKSISATADNHPAGDEDEVKVDWGLCAKRLDVYQPVNVSES